MKYLATLLLAISAPLAAQTPTGNAWNALARADVAAALELVEKHHPGAAPELGDQIFQRSLQRARAKAESRLPSVRDYGGHAAVLNGLANDLRDGHIRARGVLSRSRRMWPGVIVIRRAKQWRVGLHETSPGEPDLSDARLVACDGQSADDFAGRLIGGFYADPAVEAGLIANAPNLLLDHDNPFVPRPRACRFEKDGKAVEVTFNWRPIQRARLEDHIRKLYPPVRAGMGVSDFAGGKWIALESLDNRAASVVEQVRAQSAALRAAPMVVVDLRGNSGGNSQYADEIAEVLAGRARLSAVRQAPTCSGTFWRASADNAAALRKFADDLPPDRAPEWRSQADALARTVTAGQPFSPALPACAKADSRPRPVPAGLPPMAMTGRLVLLTDRVCFSSCLIAANLLRRLGALHVGEATDVTTRYMEVREIDLPSGLWTFSTLQKVALGTGDFGPYEPAVDYPGSLAEDDKVQAWVAALPR